jgi:hypothetical protein
MLCLLLVVPAFAAGALVGGAAVYVAFTFAQAIADNDGLAER